MVVIGELEEGVRMLSNIVGGPPEAVTIGMPVRVTLDAVTPESTRPRFTVSP